MNMFARFDENPAMTLQVIKKKKRYGPTDAHTHGQHNVAQQYQRYTSGISEVYQWNIRGIPVECQRYTSGISELYQWNIQGIPVEYMR